MVWRKLGKPCITAGLLFVFYMVSYKNSLSPHERKEYKTYKANNRRYMDSDLVIDNINERRVDSGKSEESNLVGKERQKFDLGNKGEKEKALHKQR